MRERAILGRAAGWLSFAATPAFALMALLTAAPGGGPAEILCAAAGDGTPIGGMTLMYALMGVFHSAPWLKLASGQAARRPTSA